MSENNERFKHLHPYKTNATMDLQHERGEAFRVHSYENIHAMAVIDTTQDLHGEPGYRVAEKDVAEDRWRDYWVPARHIHDERKLGNLEEADRLSADALRTVEEAIQVEEPEMAQPVDAPRLKDVMPSFTDWSEYEEE